jgi:hypothetical protein
MICIFAWCCVPNIYNLIFVDNVIIIKALNYLAFQSFDFERA